MITFPIQELMDEPNCDDDLLTVLHPPGLTCPAGHSVRRGQTPPDRHRAPVFAYRCPECGRVFNAFTSTVWRGSRYTGVPLVLILRGIAHGTPTEPLADELGLARSHLLAKRHELQQWLEQRLFPPRPARMRLWKPTTCIQPPGKRAGNMKTLMTRPGVALTLSKALDLGRTIARPLSA